MQFVTTCLYTYPVARVRTMHVLDMPVACTGPGPRPFPDSLNPAGRLAGAFSGLIEGSTGVQI